MSAPLSSPAEANDQPNFARLHGEACWFCGAVNGPLTPAGEVTLDGDAQVWQVAACQAHQGRRV
ncbi:hypothetical protein ACGFZA_08055 [Streptomyces sp. NPDC048211]|uniref:hypothetical protein n=1 Tax=Streptomyces sp. NPDC048211 TaxID=3365516 RepID=UPI00370FDC55